MREKSYYSATEITNNLFTTGSEWQTTTGQMYIGQYHKYITGEVYTGAIWNPNTSKKLVPYQITEKTNQVYRTLKTDIKTKYIAPIVYNPIVTIQDRNNGFIMRYFLYKSNERLIIEISPAHFKDYQQGKLDKNLYTGVELKWYISGNIDDVIKNSVLIEGVRTKNQKSLKSARQTIPDLSTLLNNPLQFYTDADFIVPGDINSK
jgi:hypothetical protein